MPIKDLPAENLAPLIDIAKKVHSTKYGSITFTMRIHDERIIDVTYQTFQRLRYPDENPQEVDKEE